MKYNGHGTPGGMSCSLKNLAPRAFIPAPTKPTHATRA
ncbi:Uncharacterised protein [Chlamydia trachomatis]|nr:Uncharacterised protein [Chlamydia trachomatis]